MMYDLFICNYCDFTRDEAMRELRGNVAEFDACAAEKKRKQ